MFEKTSYPENPRERRELLLSQLSALTEGERDPLPNMANASALLYQGMEQVSWAGFYLLKEGMLVLGPFQGLPACIRIPLGRGVCGTAAATGQTQLVPDVNAFPGHIACDAASRSEVVIPLFHGERLLGVLDLDSPVENRFEEEDAQFLRQVCALLSQGCDWGEP